MPLDVASSYLNDNGLRKKSDGEHTHRTTDSWLIISNVFKKVKDFFQFFIDFFKKYEYTKHVMLDIICTFYQ